MDDSVWRNIGSLDWVRGAIADGLEKDGPLDRETFAYILTVLADAIDRLAECQRIADGGAPDYGGPGGR